MQQTYEIRNCGVEQNEKGIFLSRPFNTIHAYIFIALLDRAGLDGVSLTFKVKCYDQLIVGWRHRHPNTLCTH